MDERLAPDALDPAQRALYDAITGGPRSAGPQVFPLLDAAGRLEGPFNAMLYSPQVGGALAALGAVLRFGSILPVRSREIAILVVAYAHDSAFERYAHEALGRAAGLRESELDGLRQHRYDELADDAERLLARTTAALVAGSALDDGQYESARRVLGEQTLFELTTLVGYYALLALQLRVFGVRLPDGR